MVYDESFLFYNPKYSTTTDKALVVMFFAHEIAHQWFGNLVTCDWWEDAFLNEGMASYFEVFGSESVQPTWDMTDELLILVQMAITEDSSSDAKAVRQPGVEEHDELMGAFSWITYFKGAPLMRMIAYFLGDDTFRNALQQYLKDHAYKTVTHTDLYDALDKQAKLDNKTTWDEKKTNLSGILSSWFEQPGHPVVTITNEGGGRYRVTQKRYLTSPGEDSDDQTLWPVPFTFTGKAELGQKRPRLTWFTEREIELQDQDPDFIIGNYEYQGFYRVDYDQGTWDKIIDQLNSNHELIDKYTRGQMMYDMDTFTDQKYGGKTEIHFLKLTEYLKNETEWLSWNIAVNRFKKYAKMFYNTETYDEWHRYFMDRVLTMLYDHVGWDVPDDESSASASVRSTVLETACSGGYTPCLTKARELYRKWMENQDDNPIHPDLRPVVYCHGIASGGSEEWNFAFQMYNKAYKEFIGTEKDTLRQALSCTRRQWILKKHLHSAIQKGKSDLVNEIAEKPLGQSLLWDLLLTKQVEPTESLLQALTGTYSTPVDLQKFEVYADVISDNTTASMFDSVKESIEENINWMNENEAPMREWLQKVNAKQSHVIPLSQDQSIPNIGSPSPALLFA